LFEDKGNPNSQDYPSFLLSLTQLKDRPPIPFSGISFAEYFNGAWIFFVALKIAHLPAWTRAFFHLDRIEMKAGRG